jgi:thioredoxin reductase
MKETGKDKLMPKFYRWTQYNTSMFFFIKAQLQLFPTLTIDQAITNYYKFTRIDEGEWDRNAIRMQYSRMQHEFYECAKTDKGTAGSEAGINQ